MKVKKDLYQADKEKDLKRAKGRNVLERIYNVMLKRYRTKRDVGYHSSHIDLINEAYITFIKGVEVSKHTEVELLGLFYRYVRWEVMKAQNDAYKKVRLNKISDTISDYTDEQIETLGTVNPYDAIFEGQNDKIIKLKREMQSDNYPVQKLYTQGYDADDCAEIMKVSVTTVRIRAKKEVGLLKTVMCR